MSDTQEFITCPYCRHDVVDSPNCSVCQAPLGSHGDDPLGRRVGNYVLERLLAEGANGRLYRAYHIATHQWVALKLLQSRLLDQPKSIKRLRREAEIGIRLQHHHAVKLYEFGVDRRFGIFLVMELIVGQTLHQLLQDTGPLEISRAIHIALQICEVLDKAHDLHIIHRDLKPSNVMLQWHPTTKDLVKVCDFGMAKLDTCDAQDTQLTVPGTIHGTPGYMPPEQCRGQETTKQSDIYSLGTILYEMLAGDLPFASNSVAEVLQKQLFYPPPPLHVTAPHLSNYEGLAWLQQILYRCLEKEPELRYDSVAQLRDDLALLIPSYTPLELPALEELVAHTPLPPASFAHRWISLLPEHLESICLWLQQAPLKIYLPDQRLFQTGQHAHRFYWIKQGQVRIFHHTEQNIVELERLSAGAFVGVSPFFAQTPYPFTAAATERTELYEIDHLFLLPWLNDPTYQQYFKEFFYENTLQQLIRYSPFFTQLPPPQRYEILQRGQLYSYQPQETIVNPHDMMYGLFVVVTGQVEYQPIHASSRFSGSILLMGECFGETSLLSYLPADGSYTAQTSSSLLFLPREYLDPLVEQHSFVREFLQKLVSDKLSKRFPQNLSTDKTNVDTDDANDLV